MRFAKEEYAYFTEEKKFSWIAIEIQWRQDHL